jgi:hypothetical protein
MLDHGEAKAVIVDPEFAPTMAKALALRQATAPLLLIEVEDELYGPCSSRWAAPPTKPSWPAATRNSPGSCPPTSGMPLP